VRPAAAAVAIDAGDLPLGGGALALVRPALLLLEPGGALAIVSSNPALEDDLRTWCKVEHHEYLGVEQGRHVLRRGSLSVPTSTSAEFPAVADPSTGFAPRGVLVEPGGPVYPYSLNDRDHVAPDEIAELYRQAVQSQWDATRDIPWHTIKPLPEPLEGALCQVMTFLAENELSALYVPSKFVSRIHPAYAEVGMFLATQMNDEARHIDVFLRRARLGRAQSVSSVTTSQSLLSLLQLEDFAEASFLLSVLGEGTFLDLLKYVEKYSPDEATTELLRRARVDETRHVHFGLVHVRHALRHDASLYGRLEASVRKRAATLSGAGGVPAPIADALTILAAGGGDPQAVRQGHDAFRELMEAMAENRVRRLEHAGFTPSQAKTLSDLHTPNFM